MSNLRVDGEEIPSTVTNLPHRSQRNIPRNSSDFAMTVHRLARVTACHDRESISDHAIHIPRFQDYIEFQILSFCHPCNTGLCIKGTETKETSIMECWR